MPRVAVYLLPELTPSDALLDSAVVVFDVLRATTTICYALAAGATEIVPCLEVADAESAAQRLRAARGQNAVVLGGERGGLPIAGFDLGNSPHEYTAAAVGGKSLVFTTTNGTKALERCRAARRVLVASFVNLSAAAAALAHEARVCCVCAGTRGEITREDALAAGALAQRLASDRQQLENDQARLAADAWISVAGEEPADRFGAPFQQHLGRTLADTQGGRNLASVGLVRDLDDCARIDRFDFVPGLDPTDWAIRR